VHGLLLGYTDVAGTVESESLCLLEYILVRSVGELLSAHDPVAVYTTHPELDVVDQAHDPRRYIMRAICILEHIDLIHNQLLQYIQSGEVFQARVDVKSTSS
jgi:hypothetical protein